MARLDLPVREDLRTAEDLLGPPVPPRAPEPEPVGVVEAARRHWVLVLLVTLAAFGGAVAYGLQRTPRETATTQLVVGGLNAATPGALSGYATASVALASAYSRGVDSPAVVGRVARRLGVPVDWVVAHVAASPIPESPIIRVRATARDPARAVALANATADQLAASSLTGGASAGTRSRLLRTYREAQRRTVDAQLAANAAQRVNARSPTTSSRRRLARARTAAQGAALQSQTRRQAYLDAAQSTTAAPRVQVLVPARRASSDRRSTLQLLGIAGLVGGLGLGLLLAVWRERSARPRLA